MRASRVLSSLALPVLSPRTSSFQFIFCFVYLRLAISYLRVLVDRCVIDTSRIAKKLRQSINGVWMEKGEG